VHRRWRETGKKKKKKKKKKKGEEKRRDIDRVCSSSARSGIAERKVERKDFADRGVQQRTEKKKKRRHGVRPHRGTPLSQPCSIASGGCGGCVIMVEAWRVAAALERSKK